MLSDDTAVSSYGDEKRHDGEHPEQDVVDRF
jgi:hypothetical protein